MREVGGLTVVYDGAVTEGNASVEISGNPELLRLAEDVRATNVSRVLRCGSEELARIVPLTRTRRRRPAVGREFDDGAFLATAGGWADVDTEAYLAANRASRDRV